MINFFSVRFINVLGHYSFTLSDSIMKGQLRPFNQLMEGTEDP